MTKLPSPRILTSVIIIVGCIAALSSLLLFTPTMLSSTQARYEPISNADSSAIDHATDTRHGSQDATQEEQDNNPQSRQTWAQNCAGSFLRAWIPPALQPVLTAEKIDYATTKPLDDLATLQLTAEQMSQPNKVPPILCPETLCSTQLLSVLGFPVPHNPKNHTRLFIAMPPAMPGNSLQRMIQEAAGKQKLDFEITINAHKKGMHPYLRTSERDAWDVIFGFFAYGLHRLLPSYSYYTYIVVVQPPVERWIAFFNWAREKELDYVANHHNVTSWLTAQYNCNMQFAVLSGLAPNDFSLLDRIDPSWPVPCKGYDQNHLDIVQRVKDTLSSHFKYVIPQDRLTEALPMLCSEFQVEQDACESMKKKYKWKSSPKAKQLLEGLSAQDRQAVEEQTHLDKLLYDHATQLFESQLRGFESEAGVKNLQ